MKCLLCGKEEFDECSIKVEGKIYGIVTKKEKKKNRINAVVCKNCKMVFLKQEEYQNEKNK